MMTSEKNSATTAPAVASNAVPAGGIKIPGSKMAFALITKTKQGKELEIACRNNLAQGKINQKEYD